MSAHGSQVEEALEGKCFWKDFDAGTVIAGVTAAVFVIGAGIWAGLALRRKRLSTYSDPYRSRRLRNRFRKPGEYDAVGI